jgi:hypothetical protein
VETPTLAATGSGHRDIGSETLEVAAAGGDGEQRLAGRRDCITASLGWLSGPRRQWDPDHRCAK